MDKMERDFDYILQNYGHDILLQKRVQTIYSDNIAEYQSNLERHTVRHTVPATRGLPTLLQDKMEGLVASSERIYYFRHNAYPYTGDRIYEYDDAETRVGKSTWIIDEVLAMRGMGGKVIYWMAGVTQERPS